MIFVVTDSSTPWSGGDTFAFGIRRHVFAEIFETFGPHRARANIFAFVGGRDLNWSWFKNDELFRGCREGVVCFAASADFIMDDAEVNFYQRVFQCVIDLRGFHEMVLGIIYRQRQYMIVISDFIIFFDKFFRHGPSFGILIQFWLNYKVGRRHEWWVMKDDSHRPCTWVEDVDGKVWSWSLEGCVAGFSAGSALDSWSAKKNVVNVNRRR